jgi:uracil-DNA glycosylase
MTVTVYGTPGGRIESLAEKVGRDDARRGAFYEGVTGRELEKWLAARGGDCHLFHDLSGLKAVGHRGPNGAGPRSPSLGRPGG